MNRLITIIVLATFFPMQAFAGMSLDFDPVEKEHLTQPSAPSLVSPTLTSPAAPIKQKIQDDRQLSEKLTEPSPKPVAEEKGGTNWWLWGGLGLLVVVGGAIALASRGGGSSPTTTTTTTPTATTTSVSGSW